MLPDRLPTPASPTSRAWRLRRVPARARLLIGLSILLAVAAPLGGVAVAATPEEDPDWPEDWAEMDLEERVAAVSDGELRFLGPERVADSHRHVNRIRIDAESLSEGWIELTQCHENIDAVGAAQILFGADRIRALEVVSAERIGRAWVEGHSVQLADIAPGATLCIRGESRAFFPLGEGRYRLRNGPYMRRFLDGYYPMRVVLDVTYPTDRLALVTHQPGNQPGFEVRAEGGHVAVDAAFEGRLWTCLDFCETSAASCDMAETDCVP